MMHERWDEYYLRGWGIDPDLARERLDFLRLEQERATAMFNPNDMQLPDEPLFYTKTLHPLDFKCQCKRCVRFHTLTMQDATFLRSIGVMWRTAPKLESQ